MKFFNIVFYCFSQINIYRFRYFVAPCAHKVALAAVETFFVLRHCAELVVRYKVGVYE